MLDLPWQESGKTFTKIEAYPVMAERLVRDLAIEEALQTEIYKNLEHKNQSNVNWCALSDKKQIRTRLNLLLSMIWDGRRYHQVVDMTPLVVMPSSLVGESRGSLERSSIIRPSKIVILQIKK